MTYSATTLTTLADDALARLAAVERYKPTADVSLWIDFNADAYLGCTPADVVEVRANASASDHIVSTPYGVVANTYAANVPRFAPLGLLVEPAGGANLFVNPLSVATQTITLAVGTYTLWGQLNTGAQIAITAGTGAGSAVETDQYGAAVVPGSGLGTAKFGTWVKLTVTTAGTFVFTFSGGTCTFASLASGSIPQTGIMANSVTRPLDKVGLSGSVVTDAIDPTQITVFMEAIAFENSSVATASNLFNISNNTNNERIFAQRSAATNNLVTRIIAGGSTVGGPNYTTAFRPGVVGFNRWAFAMSVAAGATFVANGQAVQSGAVTAMPTGLDHIWLGTDGVGGGTPFNGIITKFGISRLRETDSTLRAWSRIS